MIRTDLQGRIERMRLKRQHSLQPLFEAVSNSIHAVQAAGRRDGLIRVELVRDSAQPSLALAPDGRMDRAGDVVTQIKVTDNGAGFTDDNFKSFGELDTRHKAAIGGKGIGRLVWLKVFGHVDVASIYRTDGTFRQRRFDFLLPDGVENDEEHGLTAHDIEPSTTVTFSDPKNPYRDTLRHRATTVRDAVVRNFVSYFLLLEQPPRIEIVDGEEILVAALSDLTDSKRSTFVLHGYTFAVDHLKLKSSSDQKHRVYYCADGRAVKSEILNYLPDRRLKEGNDEFYYYAYVSLEYLNANVDEARTGFAIEEHANLLDEVSYCEMRAQVKRLTEEYLEFCLKELTRNRDERIKAIIDRRYPDLQYLFKHSTNELASIPVTATDSVIEDELGKIHFHNQKASRELLNRMVQEINQTSKVDYSSFSQRFDKEAEKITGPYQAILAHYMLYRRNIINIYRQILRKSGDRFEREAAIHRLIFPMGKSPYDNPLMSR